MEVQLAMGIVVGKSDSPFHPNIRVELHLLPSLESVLVVLLVDHRL